jgi:hypothetical protein
MEQSQYLIYKRVNIRSITEISKMSSEVTESYKDDKYLVEERFDSNIVPQVGGKFIELLKRGIRYRSAYRPYSGYPYVSALAKKVADSVPGIS